MPQQPQYRILVVDDMETNRLLLVKLLSSVGFAVRDAANGQEAIALWETWEPHLIWMDMRRPVLDGYEATKHIKRSVRGNATAIIALTASVLEEEKAVVLDAGCDDFVRKPFQEHILFEMMAKHLGVEYIYENLDGEADLSGAIAPITPEQLLLMPPEWCAQLHEAAINLDDDLMEQLIAQIPPQGAELAQNLTTLTQNYRFDQLIAVLDTLNS
jgi:CheY-like chemotaxis protein